MNVIMFRLELDHLFKENLYKVIGGGARPYEIELQSGGNILVRSKDDDVTWMIG